jgi:hypothetical protein
MENAEFLGKNHGDINETFQENSAQVKEGGFMGGMKDSF